MAVGTKRRSGRSMVARITHLPCLRYLWLIVLGWATIWVILLVSEYELTWQNHFILQLPPPLLLLPVAPFPLSCQPQDYAIIQYQLPEYDCLYMINNSNACSTSYATRCPDPRWFQEQYWTTTKGGGEEEEKDSAAQSDGKQRPMAIAVGCNKGTDAVHTLRLLSGLSMYDVDVWNDIFTRGHDTKPSPCSKLYRKEEVFRSVHRDAVVHCIEAMPITGARLLETATQLGWQDHLVVTNIAIGDHDGFALFPNVEDEVGVEYLGFGDCYINETQHLCQQVPVARLDTFMAQQVELSPNSSPWIEFLSIDAEGYDFEVLLGATETLRRTKYLEFEYHEVGAWPQHLLSTAIAMLKEMNFVCYWAGSYGHLWRITDCWMDFYERHAWSNVACVNIGISGTETLAARMEGAFQKTLRLNHTIHYVADEYGNPFQFFVAT